MPRSRWFALSLGIVLMTTFIAAQAPASPAGGASTPSIVTVSFTNAVLGTAEAQQGLSALEKKYSPREQQIKKLNDDLEASKRLLDGSTAKLTDSEKNQRVQDLNTKGKHLEREAEDLKNDSQADSQEVFQRVAQKVYAFLQEYSQKHQYSAVLERGSDAAPAVWYAASNVDITDQLIHAYNLKSEAPGLPETPAASRPPGASPKAP